MSKKRFGLSLAVNAYLFISTLVITLSNLLSTRPPDSHAMGFRGVENLMYYTVDSNIFMALCAVGVIIFLLKTIRSGRRKAGSQLFSVAGPKKVSGSLQEENHPAAQTNYVLSLPGWFHIVIMAAAVSVGVTFATVAFVLSPGQALAGRGYFSLFTGNNLFFHLINPLLGCADFIWLIPPRRRSVAKDMSAATATASLCTGYSIAECLFGIIPTAFYGTIYTICVVFTRTWPDIYNFTLGGHFELAPIPIVTILALTFGIAVLLTRLYNRAWRHTVQKDQ